MKKETKYRVAKREEALLFTRVSHSKKILSTVPVWHEDLLFSLFGANTQKMIAFPQYGQSLRRNDNPRGSELDSTLQPKDSLSK